MMTWLALISSLYALGAVALFICFRNAPEGFQDDGGFHLVWRNNDPDAANVACVWTANGVLQPA